MSRTPMLAVLAVIAFALVAAAPAFESDADAGSTVELHKLEVQFTSTCKDTLYIIWDFGDGSVLDGRWEHYRALADKGQTFTDARIVQGLADYRNALEAAGGDIDAPIHKYAKEGSYSPKVTAINPKGWVHDGQTYGVDENMDFSAFDGGLLTDSEQKSARGTWDTEAYSIRISLGEGDSDAMSQISDWLPYIMAVLGAALVVAGILMHPVIIIAGAAAIVVAVCELMGWINLF